VNRLQAVAHIGQRTRHDGGERVGKIALAQSIGERGWTNLLARRRGGSGRFGHSGTSRGSARYGRSKPILVKQSYLPAVDAVGPYIQTGIAPSSQVGDQAAGQWAMGEPKMAVAKSEIDMRHLRRVGDDRQGVRQ